MDVKNMAHERAKKVVLKIIEKQGKSVSQTMKDCGYSPAYAHNPQEFTSTKVFQSLAAERLSDDLITQRHNELLNASEIQHYIFPKMIDDKKRIGKGKKKKVEIAKAELTNDEIRTIVESVPGCRLIYIKRDFMGAWAFFQAPDNKSRKDAIDLGYKIKGNYSPDKIQLVKRKYQDLSNAELMALQKKLKDFLLKK